MAIRSKVILGAIFLFLLFAVFLILLQASKEESFHPRKICFRERCFLLEIADEPKERAKGLMFRKELPEGKGMLFIFPKEGVYSFWMKDTLVPLDIIWLNEEQEVVFIKEKALPCQEAECSLIDPRQKAKYVLELNAGQAEEMDLKIGDRLYFEL